MDILSPHYQHPALGENPLCTTSWVNKSLMNWPISTQLLLMDKQNRLHLRTLSQHTKHGIKRLLDEIFMNNYLWNIYAETPLWFVMFSIVCECGWLIGKLQHCSICSCLSSGFAVQCLLQANCAWIPCRVFPSQTCRYLLLPGRWQHICCGTPCRKQWNASR